MSLKKFWSNAKRFLSTLHPNPFWLSLPYLSIVANFSKEAALAVRCVVTATMHNFSRTKPLNLRFKYLLSNLRNNTTHTSLHSSVITHLSLTRTIPHPRPIAVLVSRDFRDFPNCRQPRTHLFHQRFRLRLLQRQLNKCRLQRHEEISSILIAEVEYLTPALALIFLVLVPAILARRVDFRTNLNLPVHHRQTCPPIRTLVLHLVLLVPDGPLFRKLSHPQRKLLLLNNVVILTRDLVDLVRLVATLTLFLLLLLAPVFL